MAGRADVCSWPWGCLALLVLLRGFNLYGENTPWASGASTVETAMAWLNFTKYPPSLDFLSFGGAPMFFYILHLYVLLIGYRFLLAAFGANQGTRFGVDADAFWIVRAVWLAMVPLLYVPVKTFAGYKRRSTRAWVRYF